MGSITWETLHGSYTASTFNNNNNNNKVSKINEASNLRALSHVALSSSADGTCSVVMETDMLTGILGSISKFYGSYGE